MNTNDIYLWIATLVLGAVITIVATDPLHYLLARIFGLWISQPPRSIKGIWKTSYSYRGRIPEKKKTEHQLIEFKQFGTYVVGKVLASQSQSHRLRGRIKHEIFFTGVWETDIKGEIYDGAFQFVLDVHGKKMKGMWIGFNKQHEVDSGNWEWSLITNKINRKTIEKCVEIFHKEYGQTNIQSKNSNPD